MKTNTTSWLLATICFAFACDGGGSEKQAGSDDGAGGTTSATGTVPLCIPNATQACLGPGSCVGAQACNTTGTGFSECVCGAMPSTGGANSLGGTGSTSVVLATGGAISASGGVPGTGGASSVGCVTGPGPSNACWYEPWANGSCTASLVSASSSDIAAAFTDESSYCNAGLGFSGVADTTINLSPYSYITVSAQAGSGYYFNVQITDAGGNYCYWTYLGNGSTKTYLVDLASPSYCGASSIAKALVTNVDFTTNYDYTGDFTLHVFSVAFM